MKKLVSLLLAALLVLGICSTALAYSPEEPITIEFWHNRGSGAQDVTVKGQVSAFNETVGKEKGIVVTDSYQGNYVKTKSAIMNALATGDQDFIPVICPIGLGEEDFKSYNVNADDAACAIAVAEKANKLAFLSDIEGVYEDPHDPATLISELTIADAQKFIESGNAGGGMLPKLQNCISAIQKGVSRVHILDGRVEHSLLLEFFTDRGVGTAIIDEEGSRYYHGPK